MAFEFSLATVLRVRRIVEEREERTLQKILFEISQTKETLARTDAGIEGTNASRVADVLKPLAGHNIHASYGEINQLKQSRGELEYHLSKLEQLRDMQLAVYEKARRNREMLTDMREDKKNAYEAEVAKKEQKALDDNFIARRGRPSTGS